VIPGRALTPALPLGPGVHRGEYPFASPLDGDGDDDLLSVVVVHYRGADDLIACLRSILKARCPRRLELVVVDNGSTDDGAARAAALDPRVRLTRLPSNRGFAAAAGSGFRAATGGRILLLNPDAVVDAGCLEALLAATEDADIATARVHLLDDPDRLDNAGHRLYADGLNWCRGRGETAAGRFDEAEDVLLFSGAAVLFRRSALVHAGGFDPSYFGYGEDADLGLRAARLGLRCTYAPDAVVHHRVGGTFGAMSALKVFLVERNRARVAMTHLPRARLLASPLWTVGRHLALGVASLRGRGPMGDVGPGGALMLPAMVALAHLAAAFDVPGCLARRRRLAARVEAAKGLTDAQWRDRLDADRVGLLELARSGRRA
jgi:GT2 family glycosyltransferase